MNRHLQTGLVNEAPYHDDICLSSFDNRHDNTCMVVRNVERVALKTCNYTSARLQAVLRLCGSVTHIHRRNDNTKERCIGQKFYISYKKVLLCAVVNSFTLQ